VTDSRLSSNGCSVDGGGEEESKVDEKEVEVHVGLVRVLPVLPVKSASTRE